MGLQPWYQKQYWTNKAPLLWEHYEIGISGLAWILWDYWFWILWECVNVESQLMPVWSMERSGTDINLKYSVFFSNMRTITSIQWIAWTISSSDSRCEMQSAASSQIKSDDPGGRVYVDHNCRSRRPICFEEPISGSLKASLVITCSTQDV